MCLGAQKKHLIVRVLFSTHIMFWLRNKKINFVLITSLSGGLLTESYTGGQFIIIIKHRSRKFCQRGPTEL